MVRRNGGKRQQTDGGDRAELQQLQQNKLQIFGVSIAVFALLMITNLTLFLTQLTWETPLHVFFFVCFFSRSISLPGPRFSLQSLRLQECLTLEPLTFQTS